MTKEDIIQDIIVICPNCNEPILIEKLNCRIFRHGTLKKNGQQIDSHALKELCDYYVEKDMINGCGKPFRIIKNEKDEFVAIICDYI